MEANEFFEFYSRKWRIFKVKQKWEEIIEAELKK